MSMNYKEQLKMGDIYMAELKTDGHIQGGKRPVVIIQNDKGCEYSPIIWVVPLTGRTYKRAKFPLHVFIPATVENGLLKDSMALTEQARPINRDEFIERMGRLNPKYIYELGEAFSKNCPIFSGLVA